MIRQLVHYSGHVQGVGFRMTVNRLARGTGVTGYVLNLPDGRVRLVAEGEPGEVKGLLQNIAEQMAHYIDRVDIDPAAATGEFHEFKVRY
jgi:acylphosphatase